uniref:Uncharacterized protein n=1 Tax=Myoviridae sp. ctwVB15 TaxID=2825208 RepID=A0A8S5UNJ9_9CAUD|nr:MAG TPA: hypothetical protein [Myoviridae sp. ctwVB15]
MACLPFRQKQDNRNPLNSGKQILRCRTLLAISLSVARGMERISG